MIKGQSKKLKLLLLDNKDVLIWGRWHGDELMADERAEIGNLAQGCWVVGN